MGVEVVVVRDRVSGGQPEPEIVDLCKHWIRERP